MSLVELTLHDGRRTGIPGDAALLLLDLTVSPLADKPKAKTLLRYIAANGAKHAHLRDEYRYVLSCFSMPFGGTGWAHLKDMDGADLAIAKKTGTGYVEREDGKGFDVTFNIPTGPLELAVRASIEEVRGQMAGDSDSPAPPDADDDPPPIEAPAPGKPRARSGRGRTGK